MNVTLENFLLIATHSSISGFILTILIVFGAVILTLIYIGWKKYNWDDEQSKSIDHNESDE